MTHQRTSTLYPPSTDYKKPKVRKFYVWQDRFINWGPNWAAQHNREQRPWRWCCTMCEPPSHGFRCKKGAWLAIMTITLPRHMFVRGQHHQHVARTH